MIAVIQRVSNAAVTNVRTSTVVGKIEQGLFVLLGVKKADTEKQAIDLANKLKKIRLFENVPGKMTHSALDLQLPILVVSQFTLLANTKDGNRPSFLDAENPVRAKELYELFLTELKKDLPVEHGTFGEYMKIEATLDGPVTIVLDL